MSENIVHNLYRFIKEGVTDEQLFEATANAYKGSTDEGKVPTNPGNVEKPADYIQDLKEDEKKEDSKASKDSAENTAIKTDNAGITPKPEETQVSKDMNAETPDPCAKSQGKDGQDPLIEPDKVKEEKKITPEVSSVDKVKAENEGKVPANPGNVEKPADYVQNLKEELGGRVIADGISEESVAKDIASKHAGEAVLNPQTKLWKVVSKTSAPASNYAAASATTAPVAATESKAAPCEKCKKEACECKKAVKEGVPCVKAEAPAEKEPVKEEKVTECPTVDAAKGEKLEPVGKVKEDVDVTIRTDDKEVNIVAAGGSTTVTTTDTAAALPLATLEAPPLTSDVPLAEMPPEEEDVVGEEGMEDVFDVNQADMSDDEALEMAERLMVAEHLMKLGEKEMSAKQKKFVEDMKAKKFSKKNKEKVEGKKKEIK